MGPRRPRSLLLGAVVVAAVLGSTATSAAQPAHHAVVRGAVDASGAPATAPVEWRVTHLAAGVYRVRLPRGDVSLDVPRWDAVADVTVLPLGQGVTEVRFDLDGRPVDSAFSFVAVTRR